MEHSLHVTHIKIKRSQLYLTIQLPRPDIKIQAELFTKFPASAPLCFQKSTEPDLSDRCLCSGTW